MGKQQRPSRESQERPIATLGDHAFAEHALRSGRRRAPVSRFVRAALGEDWQAAIGIASDFLAEKGSRASVITDLFQGAQVLVGNRWHVGLATAADEYRVATAISLAMDSLPEPKARHSLSTRVKALLATLAPERHDLGLRLVAAALSDDGWQVDLTPRTSSAELVTRASGFRASLVGISSTFLTAQVRAQLSSAVRALHSVGVPVIVGGGSFLRAPGLAAEIGADSVAADARSAVILARRLWTARRRFLAS